MPTLVAWFHPCYLRRTEWTNRLLRWHWPWMQLKFGDILVYTPRRQTSWQSQGVEMVSIHRACCQEYSYERVLKYKHKWCFDAHFLHWMAHVRSSVDVFTDLFRVSWRVASRHQVSLLISLLLFDDDHHRRRQSPKRPVQRHQPWQHPSRTMIRLPKSARQSPSAVFLCSTNWQRRWRAWIVVVLHLVSVEIYEFELGIERIHKFVATKRNQS